MLTVTEWSIWDLDGTISDQRHRARLAGDWDEFHAASSWDAPRIPEVGLLIAWRSLLPDQRRVAIVTACPEKWRTRRREWLRENGVLRYVDEMWMRADGDRRPSVEVKRDILTSRFLSLRDRTVAFAVEDREDLARMFLGMGIPVMLSTNSGHPMGVPAHG